MMNGFRHLSRGPSLSAYAASMQVPLPKLAVFGSGLLILFGGLGVLLGVYISCAVLFLVLFLIPVSFMMHPFWKITDPMQKMIQEVNFMKNMALLGAALLLLFIPTPWMMSVGW